MHWVLLQLWRQQKSFQCAVTKKLLAFGLVLVLAFISNNLLMLCKSGSTNQLWPQWTFSSCDLSSLSASSIEETWQLRDVIGIPETHFQLFCWLGWPLLLPLDTYHHPVTWLRSLCDCGDPIFIGNTHMWRSASYNILEQSFYYYVFYTMVLLVTFCKYSLFIYCVLIEFVSW